MNDFHKRVNDFFGPQLADIVKKQNEMGRQVEELQKLGQKIPELHDFCDRNREALKNFSAECHSAHLQLKTDLCSEICRVVEGGKLEHSAQVCTLTSQVQAISQKQR